MKSLFLLLILSLPAFGQISGPCYSTDSFGNSFLVPCVAPTVPIPMPVTDSGVSLAIGAGPWTPTPTPTPTITATPVNTYTPTLTPTVTSTPYTNVNCNSGTATGFSSSSAVSQSILPTRVANYLVYSIQVWSNSGSTTVSFTHDVGTPVPGYTNIGIQSTGSSFGWPPSCGAVASGFNNLSVTQNGTAALQGMVYAQ